MIDRCRATIRVSYEEKTDRKMEYVIWRLKSTSHFLFSFFMFFFILFIFLELLSSLALPQ